MKQPPAGTTPTKNVSTEDILNAVEANFAKQIAFTQKLVSFPSLRGKEQTAQNFIYDELKKRGYALDRWNVKVEDICHHHGYSPIKGEYQDCVNVVGTHTPREAKGRSLILNGHIDVVPTGPISQWTNHPFDPVVKDDWLYGRGGGDMKAGLVANIFALDALRSLGKQPAATVYVQSVTEEECTGNGALAAYLRGYHADSVIIPEPQDDRLVRAATGVIWFKIHIKGKPSHPREAEDDIHSAIDGAYHVMSSLKGLEAEWNSRKADYPPYDEDHKPIVILIGQMEAGDWAAMVPSWCTMWGRTGVYPGIDPKEYAKEMQEWVAKAARDHPFLADSPPEIEFVDHFNPGYVLEEGSDAENLLSRCHEEVFKKQLGAVATRGYLDARVFLLYDGTPSLVYGPIAEDIHGLDERVNLSSVKRITKSIALYIAEWCGLEDI